MSSLGALNRASKRIKTEHISFGFDTLSINLSVNILIGSVL
jgi:hypothetical protein